MTVPSNGADFAELSDFGEPRYVGSQNSVEYGSGVHICRLRPSRSCVHLLEELPFHYVEPCTSSGHHQHEVMVWMTALPR